jgi:hypothetical protein
MVGRVVTFLKSKNLDADHPSYEDLHACDQMHARGIEATREHAEHAKIRPGMYVLEIGCGIGGASRFLARELNCRVTGNRSQCIEQRAAGDDSSDTHSDDQDSLDAASFRGSIERAPKACVDRIHFTHGENLSGRISSANVAVPRLFRDRHQRAATRTPGQ